MTPSYALVIPTIGRPSLNRLLAALSEGGRLPAGEVIIVDDRPGRPAPLWPTTGFLSIAGLRSGGRGPAAARNVGWRAARADWICFLDDDVVPGRNWCERLEADLRDAGPDVVGSQARVVVPRPAYRRPFDDERRTLRPADARWITADMAYRRDALTACGGFDERFPRAYREDADIALRLTKAGGRIIVGTRESAHPIAGRRLDAGRVLRSVGAQWGNRDAALMRRKYGHGWRAAIGAGRWRLPLHLIACAAGMAGILGLLGRRRRLLRAGWPAWLGITAEFALRGIAAGTRSRREAIAMVISSVLSPPVVVAQRGRFLTVVNNHHPRNS
ncbi:glycosyltransferase [Mycobacterium sp. UM_Kg1]|uniref:glycosyltransferase family 2 protein n=1 Tax=Mycobacterium sp. UM_Kg1 TaxID=1545691 RepID=UPI0006966D18|nr:glycosyltransferase [Mycobacterium sp. UM_Kg1]